MQPVTEQDVYNWTVAAAVFVILRIIHETIFDWTVRRWAQNALTKHQEQIEADNQQIILNTAAQAPRRSSRVAARNQRS